MLLRDQYESTSLHLLTSSLFTRYRTLKSLISSALGDRSLTQNSIVCRRIAAKVTYQYLSDLKDTGLETRRPLARLILGGLQGRSADWLFWSSFMGACKGRRIKGKSSSVPCEHSFLEVLKFLQRWNSLCSFRHKRSWACGARLVRSSSGG